MYTPPDYLNEIDHPFEHEEIFDLRMERRAGLYAKRLAHYRQAVEAVADIRTERYDFSGDVIKVGQRDELNDEQFARFYDALRTFCPWKKGPFELFGVQIDAEWRSDWKWNRILPHIQPLRGRRVADVGCHNGYFMFRMADQQPESVFGFDPYPKLQWNFQLIHNLVRDERLFFELLGVEHIDLYPDFFDSIFCLGILYHHTDPVGLLRKLRSALAPKGEIVIDCQGIPGNDPIALVPRGRYAQARGIWFLPTQSCLVHWMLRAGFSNIRIIFAEPLSTDEQRRTRWADVDSLAEFLDPSDLTRTVEGYPAPWRYYAVAQK